MLERLPGWFAAGAMLLFFCGAQGYPVYGGEMLTDPTRPPMLTSGQAGSAVEQSQKWRLTATITGPARRVAVINGQVLQIGEPIDGAVLVEVTPGSAFLAHRGKRLQLQLNGKVVKHSVKTAP